MLKKKYLKTVGKERYALWKTYWGLTLVEFIYYLPAWVFVPENVYWVHSFMEVFTLFFTVFFLVCVWRSANKYKGRKVWYFLAKFTAALFLIGQIFSALQFGEMFKLTY